MPEDDTTKDLPNDQPTANLSDSEKLDLIVTRLGTLEQKVGTLGQTLEALEQKVDERLKDTRPLWEAVQTQLQQINYKLDAINKRFLHTELSKTVSRSWKTSEHKVKADRQQWSAND